MTSRNSDPDCGGRFNVRVPMEVRWGDMDAMGHVNNAAYFTYFESGRMKYFEAIGLDRIGGGVNHGPAVVSATIHFRKQVHYPSLLVVGVRVVRFGTKSFSMEHELRNQQSGEIVADGTTVVAWVDYTKGKSIPLPGALKDAIRTLEGGEIDDAGNSG